jgi:hypothetical protein
MAVTFVLWLQVHMAQQVGETRVERSGTPLAMP